MAELSRFRKIAPRVALVLVCGYLLFYPGSDSQDHRIGGLGVGILLVDLFLRSRLRWGASVDPELERVTREAAKLEKTDPAAATKLLDDYFRKAAERERALPK